MDDMLVGAVGSLWLLGDFTSLSASMGPFYPFQTVLKLCEEMKGLSSLTSVGLVLTLVRYTPDGYQVGYQS
jgi:hypothetical protein